MEREGQLYILTYLYRKCKFDKIIIKIAFHQQQEELIIM